MTVIVSAVSEGIKSISFDDSMNANVLTESTLTDLKTALLEVIEDDSVKVIILNGSDSVFSVGFAKTEIKEQKQKEKLQPLFAEVLELITSSPKLFIASVAGYVLGGGFSLALSADILLASDNAVFGFPEISVGEVPFGNPELLVKSVGRAKASDILLSGRNVLAKEANEIGLISRLIPSGDLFAETVSLSVRLASFSLEKLVSIKEQLNKK